MKFKYTVILLIIVSIIAAYVFLWENKQYRQDVWKQRQFMVLPDYKAVQVNKIEIKRAQETVLLEREEVGKWKMLKPLQLRADVAEIAKILSQFEFLFKIGTIKEGDVENFNFKDYGLDKPQVIVTLFNKSAGTLQELDSGEASLKSKYVVNIGDKISAGKDNVYINVEGEKEIFLVKGAVLEEVSKSLNELRNKWVFEFDIDAVERIMLQKDSGVTIECSKEDRLWWVNKPISDRGDTGKIRSILGELKNLEIAQQDFVSDKEEDIVKYGLDKPKLTITVGSRGEIQSLLLGHYLDNKIYAKRHDESSIFLVHDVVLYDFDLEANDLRDKVLLRFDAIGTYGIEKVELKYPGTTLTMEKTKRYDWLIKSPEEVLADRDTVRDFVEKIKELPIQEYVDDSGENYEKYGLGDTAIEVSVFRKIGQGEMVKFLIGKTDEQGGLCYVKRTDGNTVYSVPTEKFYDIATGGFLAFRDRVVLEFSKEMVFEISVEKDGKKFVCERDRDQVDMWHLTSPVKVAADTDAVNQVIWDLAFLKASKILTLATDDLEQYGLDNPEMKVSASYEGPANFSSSDEVIAGKEDVLVKSDEITTHTLLIGDRVDPENERSEYYAKLSNNDMIFQIGWTDIRDFSAGFASKKLFDFDVTQTNHLNIKHPEKELSFKRNAESIWEMTLPESKIIKGNFVDRIIAAMNALLAESVVLYSDDVSEYKLDNPRFSVTVGSNNGEITMLVGKETRAEFYVMNKELNFVYLVKKNKIEDMIKEALSTEIR